MATAEDRAYLEMRLAACLQKAEAEADRGLARVHRDFADQYARALASVEGVAETPAAPHPQPIQR